MKQPKSFQFRQQCLHGFEPVGGDLAVGRHCGERSRFRNYRGTDRVLIQLPLLPKGLQLMYVPREMLDQCILDHFDRFKPTANQA